jgi:hypothetical protein
MKTYGELNCGSTYCQPRHQMKVNGELCAPVSFLPDESSQYPFDRRWVVPRACLDFVDKAKVSCPCRKSNLDSLADNA